MRVLLLLLILLAACSQTPSISIEEYGFDASGCEKRGKIDVDGRTPHLAQQAAEYSLRKIGADTLVRNEIEIIYNHDPKSNIAGIAYRCAGES